MSIKVSSPLDHELGELVTQAQKGDKNAISLLVESVQDEIYRFCYYLARDKASAEDLCQETLLRAILNLAKLKEPGRFKAWVLQTGKNIFLDELKRHENKLRSDGEPPLDERGTNASAQDTHLQIREALLQLLPEDRLILILIDLHEFTYKEAAEMMKLSEEAVTSRVFRARKDFVKKFEGNERNHPARSSTS
ncbi:MAG: hypothetical protein C5B49_07950 [Bdellovibrio sp.]|nr:MAG: hypothetical protein C5B49_07950 [Bdellovibrio sp.]